ncbi:MAG: hypothetical protein FJX03_07425 [Alphaproteobacteria bacterium]|nr:hypothetical protein [Alphaproteobacteria bacterium]
MKMKWVTFVLLGSLIGATYAHDSKNEDDQPTKLNLSSPSNYLKPLQDLKVETLKLATEMLEKNAVLKKKLSLRGVTNFPSFATLIHPAPSSLSEKGLEARAEIHHQIFENLQKNVMGILFDLLEENKELERLLNERKEIRRKDRSFQNVLSKFNEISAYVNKIQNTKSDRNVHDLDAFVTGSHLKIKTLLEIGRYINWDDGRLNWDEIIATILEMIMGMPGNANLTDFDGHSITVAEFKDKVWNFFENLSLQFASPFWDLKRELVRELCSRMVTLTNILRPSNPNIFPLLVICISENQLTNGGCADGKVNRAFMFYLTLLGCTGLGDEVDANSAKLLGNNTSSKK